MILSCYLTKSSMDHAKFSKQIKNLSQHILVTKNPYNMTRVSYWYSEIVQHLVSMVTINVKSYKMSNLYSLSSVHILLLFMSTFVFTYRYIQYGEHNNMWRITIGTGH